MDGGNPFPEKRMADISFETLGACPVPGTTPAGEDARYEPEYAAVLEEIEKLSFSGQGSPVSWTAIEKNAVAILSEKSKDMQIAAYLGVALWHNRGLDGLADGIRVLAGLLENFWETGWPALKRMRGRVNAIDWWHERAYAFVQEAATQDAALTAQGQQDILDALAKLDGLVATLMPDASPLRDLLAAVRRLPVSPEPEAASDAPATQAEPETGPPKASPATAPATPPAPSSATPPAESVAADDPIALRRHFASAGLAYLAAARPAEPGNASLWRMSRLIIWGSIAALPPSEGGQTLLPVPDMATLAQARQKLQTGNPLDAALEAEAFFATAPFCLDAQETIHAALCALGPSCADAARCVLEESLSFFSRLPGMDTLSFTDGTPFAEPQTLAWLRGGAALLRPPHTESLLPSGGDACDAAFQAARDLLAQNKLTEALAALDAAKTPSPAVNLRLNLYQLRLLREAGKNAAAQALAEALLEEITARDLDAWDPQLSLATLTAARDAFGLAESRYERELREVRRRIARLRPASALD